MRMIYEPRGRAREFSPLALNVYDGCDHRCTYCYMEVMKKMHGGVWRGEATARVFSKADLSADANKYWHGKQVMLSFSGDPYCKADLEYRATRMVLEVLNKNNVTVAILTKGGCRCLRDLDLFHQFEKIKVGATLTCIDDETSFRWEPGAACPHDRIETLRVLAAEGIQTWVSLEPVIDPATTLKLIDETCQFVDHYKVGKMNYHPMREGVSWEDFGEKVVRKLRDYGKAFYVKNDLAACMRGGFEFKECERDPDFLALDGA